MFLRHAHAARRTAFVLLASLLVACTQTIVPELPHDVPDTWRGANAPADASAPALDAWWKAFDDPVLDQLVVAAQRDNLNLQIAAERLKAARHLYHRARADYWPNLNFRVYEETAPGGQTGYLEMGFDTTWELGLFGRAQSSKRVNAADLNTARIDDAAARITVTAEVVRVYVELCATRARAHLADEIANARKRQFDLAQTRVNLHLGARAEADRAGNEWRAAVADASDAAAPLAESAAALSVLLGKRLADADLPQGDAVPMLTASIAAQPPADLVRTRPEIRRAEQAVLRAAGDLGISRADLYPKFSIVGTLISSTALTGDVDHPNKAVPLIGPALSLPIIDWHQRRAVVGAREAALAASVLAYREAVLEGVAEVEAALARYQNKSALLAHADESIASATRAQAIVAASRKIGLIDDADVTSATLALQQAQLQRVQALRECALAYVALYKAFGGSMPPLVTPP